jgi:hypothetical protein
MSHLSDPRMSNGRANPLIQANKFIQQRIYGTGPVKRESDRAGQKCLDLLRTTRPMGYQKPSRRIPFWRRYGVVREKGTTPYPMPDLIANQEAVPIAVCILSIIAFANASVFAVPPRSFVRYFPSAKTASNAFSARSAASYSPR